jgi:Zn-dependent protease with chaperone function
VATDRRVKACPDCGSLIDHDPSFPLWCPACDWNLDPQAARRQRGGRRMAEKAADRLARRLYQEVRARPPRSGGGNLNRLVIWPLACFIHLLTVAVAAAAALLIAPGFGLIVPVRILLAALLGGCALYVQPFRSRKIPQYIAIGREDAPALFALVDEVALAIGGPGVDIIVPTATFNASYFKLSARRPAIAIGLTLWSILTPQERVALLGHDFGHRINGDLRRTVFVGRAITTVRRWRVLLEPEFGPVRHTSSNGLGALSAVVAELLMPLLLIPLALLVETFGNGMQLIASRQGQRSEYYADELAAGAAGTAAAVSLLEKMLIGDMCQRFLLHTIKHQRDTNVWHAVRAFAESVPETEWQRRSRLATRRLQRVDSSHPPSQLRASVLLDRPTKQPSVVLDAGRSAIIDAEFARAGALPPMGQKRSGVFRKLVSWVWA